ncbi:MAG: FAD-dependent oxidoreductase [Dehalococcoidia bacterium]|nr:FAD-dependent oxidoreductase [Dehalococcoidia bacterium]
MLKAKPDAVVVATGATPIMPDGIPGVKRANVAGALDILGNRALVGTRVVIVGGGLIGCETAEYLAEQGKRVTVVEMLDQLACDLAPLLRKPLLDRLVKLGVNTEVRTKVTEIAANGVNAAQGGIRRWFETDTVVLAVGMAARKGLAADLQGKVQELHIAGDCAEPRKIVDAMSDGARVGFAV